MKKKNVILISFDCVRADVGYSDKFPTIKKLCKKGVSFSNCISSSPLTPVSHATILTGLQPYNHGIRHLFLEKLKTNVVTLQQVLRKNGYSTAAVVSCPGMNRWYGFNKGFDFYDDEIPKLADGSDPLKTVDVKLRGTALKRADLVIERASEWMKNRKEPFILFIHFFDAHWPYKVPERFGGDNPYEEAISYTDHCLGLFLNELDSLGILNDSLLVCFSDHGEDLNGLYKNDKGGKKHPEEFGHGCLLYDQTQKTMFIINDPSIPHDIIIDDQVRLVDLMSTVLDILGVKDAQKRDGVSLLPLIRGEKFYETVAYSETFYPEEKKPRGVEMNKKAYRIGNKYKIIVNVGKDDIEFYDLEENPNEE